MDDPETSNLISLTTEQRIARAIEKLPTLTADHVPLDDSCPICLLPFTNVLDGSSQNEGLLHGLTPKPIELNGVTRLEGCGHVFCRVDLIEWIRGRHGTCPACRHAFLDVKPISDSDNESSDGDYIPDDDEDDDDDDVFMDTDGFTDVDDIDDEDEDVGPSNRIFRTSAENREGSEDMFAYVFMREEENMGLSDGYGSESVSEADLMVSGDEGASVNDDAQVHIIEQDNSLQGSSSHGHTKAR